MHDRLRPHHFVAQGYATGNGVQPQGQAVGGFFSVMFHRGIDGCHALALEPQGPSGGQQVQHGGGQRAAAHAEGGNQHERGEQGAGDGPGGVCRIQLPAGLAQVLRVSGQGANQHRQGAAHQQRGNAHQRERQYPGQQAHVRFQPGKRAGRQAHGEGRSDAQHRHQHFQTGVEHNRLLHPVRPAAEQQAAQGQSGKERADPGGDGIDLDAYDQRQLLDPQHLIHQRRGAGDKQQQGGDQQRRGGDLRGRYGRRFAGDT
ncbi:hypothetical protein D3C73_551350 [compost metagenome]